MEVRTKLILIGVLNIFPLILDFVVTRLLVKPTPSWWWFFGLVIFLGICDLILGLYALYKYIFAKQGIEQKLDPKEAMRIAIKEKQEELDNPDNFVMEDKRIMNVGEPGKPKTPILWMTGKGSELGNKMDGLIDLSKAQVFCCWCYNMSKEQIIEVIMRMAENPEQFETETRLTNMDEFGRPVTTVISKKMTQEQKKQEENKKEAEELNKI